MNEVNDEEDDENGDENWNESLPEDEAPENNMKAYTEAGSIQFLNRKPGCTYTKINFSTSLTYAAFIAPCKCRVTINFKLRDTIEFSNIEV